MKNKPIIYPKLRINICKLINKQVLQFVLTGIFLLTSVVAFPNDMQQETRITGTVTDSSTGEGLPGANVTVRGTTTGVTTNLDGNYSIVVPNDEAVLVYSFIGYLQEVREPWGQTVINVALRPDILDLDEIVVIGYGVQRKRLVTGATAQVDGEDLENQRTTSVLQAMQGQMSGINISSTSGQPGEDFKVVIRGVGTTNHSNPLYIVDGVQTENIKYLNSSDIESVDILKDAASAAIYGSQAANGVILITTKQGKAGVAQITFDTYYGLQNRAKKIEMLNAREYAMIMNEQHINSGGSPTNLPFNLSNLPAYTQGGSADTDWLDEMFVQNAITQNYTLGASGGSEQSIYSMSISYSGQEGVIGGKDLSNYDRYSTRFNSEHKFYNNRIKVGQNLTFSYIQDNGIRVGNQYFNSLRGAFNTSPLLPVYDDDGEFFNSASTSIVDQNGQTYWNNRESSPYAAMVLNNQNRNNHQVLVGNFYTEIEIFKNFKYRPSLGIEYISRENRSFDPIYELSIFSFRTRTEATQRFEKRRALNFDNLLYYDINMGVHSLNTMAGMSAREAIGSWIEGKNTDLAFNDLAHAWLNNATNEDGAQMQIRGAPDDEYKLLSYFGRVQYNYNETYMINVTVRADGSSRFAKDNRWGYFPSVSAGWVLSNEPFFNFQSINFLKLRASWGQNGNQAVDAFNYLAPIRFTQAAYAFGDTEGVNTPGAYPERLSNEDLKWETAEQLNIGIDSRFFQGKLQADIDWFKKTNRDWLIVAPILATAGAEPPFINGGNIINTGFELGLTYRDNIGEFNYGININGTYLKNEVQEVPTEDGKIHGASNMLYNNSTTFYRAETGYPIGYFWGYETDGIFQDNGEVTSHTNTNGVIIQPNARPGDVRYVDQNDDGRINDDDKVMVGDPNPDFLFGFSFTCNYKGFDFAVLANGVAGNQLVQSYRNHTDQNANYTTAILDRWNGRGTSDRIPMVTNQNRNYQFSDLFIHDGDFLRISNITLGYELTQVFKNLPINQFRIYASVQNLYTFTKYDGMDPEIGYGFDEGPMDRFSYGIDLGFYPRPRTVLFGASIKF